MRFRHASLAIPLGRSSLVGCAADGPASPHPSRSGALRQRLRLVFRNARSGEPGTPQGGLGAPRRGGCALGRAHGPEEQGRRLGPGRVLRDRRGGDRERPGRCRPSRPPGARDRALDFGCGVGRLTRALGDRFDAVVGVDISAGMVEQARRLNDASPALRVPRQRRTGPRRLRDGLVRPRLLEHCAPAPALGGRDRAVRGRLPPRRARRRARRLRDPAPDRVPVLAPATTAGVRVPAPARRLRGVDAAADAADADADDRDPRSGRSGPARGARRSPAGLGADRRGPVRARRYYVSPR